MNSKFELTERARRWIKSIRSMYRGRPLAPAVEHAEPQFKIL